MRKRKNVPQGPEAGQGRANQPPLAKSRKKKRKKNSSNLTRTRDPSGDWGNLRAEKKKHGNGEKREIVQKT